MGMLGNPADNSLRRVANDSFNGDNSTVAFTLSAAVNNTTDIEVLVDNVQQSPYDGSYSVSGTTLTFSAAPATGTNNIYVIYHVGRTTVVGEAVPQDGSVTTAKIADDAVHSSKIAAGAAVSNIGYTPLNKAGDTMTGNLTTPGLTIDGITKTKYSEVVLAEVDVTGSFTQIDIPISPSYSGYAFYKVLVAHWHLAADGDIWCNYSYGGTKKGGWYGGYYRAGEGNSSGVEGYSSQPQCEIIGTNTTSYLNNAYCFKGEFALYPLGQGNASDHRSAITWLANGRLAGGLASLIVGSALSTDTNLPDNFVLYSNQATTAIKYTLIGINP